MLETYHTRTHAHPSLRLTEFALVLFFHARHAAAPGARFRESLDMGSFSGGSSTLVRAIDSLREEFGPDRYNVLTRNCNTFSSALCEELLGKPIPGYVNRLAWMGESGEGKAKAKA